MDGLFSQFAGQVTRGDVLVFNDTRVIKARLTGAKDSGGKIEVLVERVVGADQVLAQVRASKSLRAGSRLRLGAGALATVLGRQGEFFELRFEGCRGRLCLARTTRQCAAAALYHACSRCG